jgi:hypothetical protein
LFASLFLSFIRPHANTDKTLEKEFLLILKQCDISPENDNTSSTDSSVNSSVNSNVDSNVNSNVNSSVNSNVNSSVHSNVNSNINSNINSNVNSSVNSNKNNTSNAINIDCTEKSLISNNIDIQSESYDGDISLQNTDCTEKSLISDNIDIQSESYDGDIDSAHYRHNIRAAGMHIAVVPTNQASIMFPISARSPRIPWIHFRISKLMDDTTSPLLNPNAIHERRSSGMLKIQENCSNDDIPENKEQKLPGEGSI